MPCVVWGDTRLRKHNGLRSSPLGTARIFIGKEILNMGKVEFVKIKGKTVAFIDETAHDIEHIPVFSRPVLVKCDCEIFPNQYVAANDRGEIIPSDGSSVCGFVVEVRGDCALVQILY